MVRMDREDLLRAEGGVWVKFVVTHANVKVSVEDDGGGPVSHARAHVPGKDGG